MVAFGVGAETAAGTGSRGRAGPLGRGAPRRALGPPRGVLARGRPHLARPGALGSTRTTAHGWLLATGWAGAGAQKSNTEATSPVVVTTVHIPSLESQVPARSPSPSSGRVADPASGWPPLSAQTRRWEAEAGNARPQGRGRAAGGHGGQRAGSPGWTPRADPRGCSHGLGGVGAGGHSRKRPGGPTGAGGDCGSRL